MISRKRTAVQSESVVPVRWNPDRQWVGQRTGQSLYGSVHSAGMLVAAGHRTMTVTGPAASQPVAAGWLDLVHLYAHGDRTCW